MNPFSLPFVQMALAASLLTGMVLAWLGIFILTRQISFAGLASAQLAALGTVISMVLGLHLVGFGLALGCVLLGVWALTLLSKSSNVPQEAWLGCLYIGSAALAVLILAKAPSGEIHSMNIFFGNLLSLGFSEVLEALGIFLASMIVLGIWFHRWVWMFFDPISVEVSGIKTLHWNFLFLCLLALVMTVAIHLLGVLVSFAYLLLPASAGLLAGRRITSIFLFASCMAGLSTAAGVYLSFVWDLPTGPLIAALLGMGTLALGAGRRLLKVP